MNESELRALLSGLRTSKRKGELDTDEKLAQQTVKWRDTLEYSVLEACTRHYSEEVTGLFATITLKSNLLNSTAL